MHVPVHDQHPLGSGLDRSQRGKSHVVVEAEPLRAGALGVVPGGAHHGERPAGFPAQDRKGGLGDAARGEPRCRGSPGGPKHVSGLEGNQLV